MLAGQRCLLMHSGTQLFHVPWRFYPAVQILMLVITAVFQALLLLTDVHCSHLSLRTHLDQNHLHIYRKESLSCPSEACSTEHKGATASCKLLHRFWKSLQLHCWHLRMYWQSWWLQSRRNFSADPAWTGQPPCPSPLPKVLPELTPRKMLSLCWPAPSATHPSERTETRWTAYQVGQRHGSRVTCWMASVEHELQSLGDDAADPHDLFPFASPPCLHAYCLPLAESMCSLMLPLCCRACLVMCCCC
mmetsp:Transcript_122967/g.216684  ORF Transcript_122967/g.216684 Transcript_122967/m.216684 type:complete len:247 (+) Transcript_122967:66-806(+)